jgi:serine/threonine protein kinase
MTNELTNLLRACRSAAVPATAEDVADAAWLARWMDPVPPPGESIPAPPAPPPPPEPLDRPQPLRPPPAAPPERAQTGDDPGGVELTVPTAPGRSGARGGQTFWAAGAPALPRPLEIARALRPLFRRVPSRSRFVLDVDETVRRLAEEGVCDPVLRPAPERWLRVAVVTDTGTGADLWAETVGEFRGLLAGLGAFRDVRAWGLDTDSSPPVLRPGRAAVGAPARRPKELADPGGRTLVMALSPFLTPAWYDGTALAALRVWSAHGPVVLVPLLPEYLWAQTALAGGRGVRLTAPGAGAANARLRAELLRSWPGDEAPAGAAFPLAVLEPASLGRWAGLVAGRAESTHGLLFAPTAAVPVPERAGPATAAGRLERFWATASPVASRLAGLLAAAAVITLPVLRLVRQTLLPEAGQPHEAEVLFGGLLRRAPGAGVDGPQFEFHPGVREMLLDAAPTDESLSVLEAVSDYLGEHLASGRTFRSVITDPTSAAGELGAEAGPFARIAAEVFARAGGDLARVVRRVARPADGRSPQPPDTAAPPAPGSSLAEPGVAREGAAATFEPPDHAGAGAERLPWPTDARRAVGLIVGIDRGERDGFSPARRFASADAEALAVLLADPEVCGFPRTRVALLTGAAATHENLVSHLTEWLPAQCRGAELVFVHFVGHGLYGSVGRSWDGYLLAHDADPGDPTRCGVTLSELQRLVDRLEADTVIVSLDCSRIGPTLHWEGGESSERSSDAPRPAWRSFYFIASCSEGEQPIEAPDLGHGLFTYHLLRGIKGAADVNADGRVGVEELGDYLIAAVGEQARGLGAQQTPWCRAKSPGGEYISTVRSRTAPVSTAPEPPARTADEPPSENFPRTLGPYTLLRRLGPGSAGEDLEFPARTADEPPIENFPRTLGLYTLLRRLGSGSVGVTYVAHDPIGRSVALKVPHEGARCDPATRSMFVAGDLLGEQPNEWNAENLCRILDADEVDGCPFVAAEFISGERIDAYWQRERERLGPSGLANLVHRVARVMARHHTALFRRAPAHGNLKPGNVLVCPAADGGEPRIVILDYGLGPVLVARNQKVQQPVTGDAGFAAFGYLSPELLVPGWNVPSERSDVYSLGVVLYQLIAAQLPFETSSWDRLVDAVLNGYAWPPSELNEGVRVIGEEYERRRQYGPFDEVCQKAMARLPADRYGSMAEFAEALAAIYVHAPGPFGRTPATVRDALRTAVEPHPARQAPPRPAAEPFSVQSVARRYPAPIAVAYQKIAPPEQAGEQKQSLAELLARVFALVNVFESATAYLTFLAMSDLFRARAATAPVARWLSQDEGFDFALRPLRMSLARWLHALSVVTRELRGVRDCFVPELASVCATDSFRRLISGDLMSRLLRFRGDVLHGSSRPTEEECAGFLREFHPHLHQFLRDISFVERYPLASVTLDGRADDPPVSYRLHSWTGARVERGPRSRLIDSPHPLPVGVPFVMSRDVRNAMCLWPFLVQRYSRTSDCVALYTFQQIIDGGRFLSRIRAVSVLDPSDVWQLGLHTPDPNDFGWLWEALARLPHVFAVRADLRSLRWLTEPNSPI